MSTHNCTSIIGASAAMLTSLVLTNQSDAFHCKTRFSDGMIISFSLFAFIGFNSIHKPELAKHADAINQFIILLPPILNGLVEFHGCDASRKKNFNEIFDLTNILTCFLTPLVVYQVVANDKLRDKICSFYEGKGFGKYHLNSGMDAGAGHARRSNMQMGGKKDIDQAKREAMAALNRAMATIRKE